jgi:hypothetical protein
MSYTQQMNAQQLAARQKAEAQQLVMALIKAGLTPDPALVEAAGLTGSLAGAPAGGSPGGSPSTYAGYMYTNPVPAPEPDGDRTFYQATGAYRFGNQNVNVPFTGSEYDSFARSVGMSRTDTGRVDLIRDALSEGRISTSQAGTLLAQFGLS